jgi:predicted transposase YbfD/YdcC
MADKARVSSCYIELEVNKGRTELRRTSVSDSIGGISKDWAGLAQVVSVERTVRAKGKESRQVSYFISSKRSNAFFYAEGIRSHWSIENSLHWVKDVTFGEDASMIKMGNAPQNMSTIKNIAINILRKNDYANMEQAMRLISNDIQLLNKLIA